MNRGIKVGAMMIVLAFSITSSWSQQLVGNTQYMWNQARYNPAYAGSQDALTAIAMFRQQWVGLEGAPATEQLGIHSPIFRGQGGIGLQLMRDALGINQEMSVGIQASYHLRLQHGKLAFGIGLDWVSDQMDWTAWEATDNDDPNLAVSILNEQSWNAGTGILYYTKMGYAGISIPRILENSIAYSLSEAGADINAFNEKRHIYGTAGRSFQVGPKTYLKPSALVRYVDGAPLQVDLTTMVLLQNTLWLGLGYRWMDSVDLLMQYSVTDQWHLGYAFDFAVHTTQQYRGSHEIFISYDLVTKKNGYNHPRFF